MYVGAFPERGEFSNAEPESIGRSLICHHLSHFPSYGDGKLSHLASWEIAADIMPEKANIPVRANNSLASTWIWNKLKIIVIN